MLCLCVMGDLQSTFHLAGKQQWWSTQSQRNLGDLCLMERKDISHCFLRQQRTHIHIITDTIGTSPLSSHNTSWTPIWRTALKNEIFKEMLEQIFFFLYDCKLNIFWLRMLVRQNLKQFEDAVLSFKNLSVFQYLFSYFLNLAINTKWNVWWWWWWNNYIKH